MTGFATFDDYLAHARVTELTLSPDGTRLVATVAEVNAEGNAFVSALWDVDPQGRREARRLTRSGKGESGAAFTPDGSLLFVSGRDPATDDDPPALWRLPAVGEAERVVTRPGGVSAVHVARDSGTAVVTTSALPGTRTGEDDAQRRKSRADAKTGAILHTSSPVRYWDHDLGPDEVRLLAWNPSWPDGPVDLTPEPGRALDETSLAVTPDGRTVVAAWFRRDRPGFPTAALVAIDVATGERRVLAEAADAGFEQPAISPDGRWVVCVRQGDCTRDEPWTTSLWLVPLDGSGPGRELLADPDVEPGAPQFGADENTIFFLADERGHAPVFRLDATSGDVVRLTAGGHHTALRVAPDGTTLYALRDAWDSPPQPVRIDADASDADALVLPAPGAVDVPGRLERLHVTVEDGTEIGAWLVLPDGASPERPAPLLLFVHGGPLGSWNGWSWRWNPWLMAARGYAVVLPDPALSTGYGVHLRRRGWQQWGGAPFTDLMSVTDAVVARADIDETRTAALGGSYGGYMTNWIAGHTDRFRCLVTHASLWNMAQFHGTTDHPGDWALEWGVPADDPDFYRRWSPHTHVDAISTPMLVIHGDKDYRVPVGEALSLWWDLQRHGVESSYLYFPDEGHWILKPGNARVWYETVWAWLAHHLTGEPWQRPEWV